MNPFVEFFSAKECISAGGLLCFRDVRREDGVIRCLF